MNTQQIAYAALALMVVAGVVIFLVRRSKLNEVKVHHGLDADSLKVAAQGIDAVERVVSKAFGSVETLAKHGFPAVSNVAGRVAEIAQSAEAIVDSAVAPVSRGMGDVLSAVADRIKTRQADLNTLTSQAIALAQEIERLKGRHIDVTRVTAQLKLGLIEVSKQYDSWKKETLSVTPAGMLGGETMTEYVGLQRASYRIQVGLDIEKLQFQLTTDNRVLVHGLQNIEILGLKGLKIENLFREKRQFVSAGRVGSAKAEILPGDEMLMARAEKHRETVMDEIQCNDSIKDLAQANASFGLAFLQACLSPGGLKVEESRELLAEPLRFTELCRTVNATVRHQLESSYEIQSEIEAKSRAIEGQILTIAMSSRGSKE